MNGVEGIPDPDRPALDEKADAIDAKIKELAALWNVTGRSLVTSMLYCSVSKGTFTALAKPSSI